MKLYLNVIRGQLAVRQYPTKEWIYAFTSEQVLDWLNTPKECRGHFHINARTNDIYDYLIHGVGLVYTNAFGQDRLTDKGLELFWRRYKK